MSPLPTSSNIPISARLTQAPLQAPGRTRPSPHYLGRLGARTSRPPIRRILATFPSTQSGRAIPSASGSKLQAKPWGLPQDMGNSEVAT